MMKKIILAIGAVMCIVLSHGCHEEEIMTYNPTSGAFLEFVKDVKDSTEFSFTFHPGVDDYEYQNIEVRLVGIPVDYDRTFKLEVVDEYTTASKANYSVPETFIFHKNRVKEVATIHLIKTPNLETEAVRLMLRLVPTDDFQVGETSHLGYIVWMNNKISKPSWWDSLSGSYLGSYSDKKYRLFIEVTGVGDLDPNNPDECRYNSLLLKKYLREQKEAGNTVYEADGYTEMTVNVIG